jgi:hypothetical protein
MHRHDTFPTRIGSLWLRIPAQLKRWPAAATVLSGPDFRCALCDRGPKLSKAKLQESGVDLDFSFPNRRRLCFIWLDKL